MATVLADILKRECAAGSACGLTSGRYMTRLFDGTVDPWL
jgi:hypothetical protein